MINNKHIINSFFPCKQFGHQSMVGKRMGPKAFGFASASNYSAHPTHRGSGIALANKICDPPIWGYPYICWH